jgi:hypothetical protein
LFVSAAEREDRDTVAIPRDRLLGLVKETTLPPPPNPHLIARGTRHPFERVDHDEGVSPVAVLAVIGLLIALFIAVLQLN